MATTVATTVDKVTRRVKPQRSRPPFPFPFPFSSVLAFVGLQFRCLSVDDDPGRLPAADSIDSRR